MNIRRRKITMNNFLHLNAKNLPCPEPLMLLKRTIEKNGSGHYSISLGNTAAEENISRFCNFSGYEILEKSKNENGSIFYIQVKSSTEEKTKDYSLQEAETTILQNIENTKTVVLIKTDCIGDAEPKLGAILMKGFITTLSELLKTGDTLIFMNKGVYLVSNTSGVLEALKKILEKNITILVCGTCIDYYSLNQKIVYGTISNMYEITEELLQGKTIVL